ncbi:hypothetical protein [Fangia hongkongensis]|uniref:hypothetical protein n=1 Tax=Fangia hongkongensis TaxID=270495 RepID=UPI0003701CFA|nr:hypothetical protein [Fangia hongkongensis]MBK2124720.1 hypothetical protein [Fangia hongkongensis]
MKKPRHNPVAKNLMKLNYNAGVHQKTNKAKRANDKRRLLKSLSHSVDSYLFSIFCNEVG